MIFKNKGIYEVNIEGKPTTTVYLALAKLIKTLELRNKMMARFIDKHVYIEKLE
jgi:hypothetical protein